MSLSFTQLRKLRECGEYKYALAAAYSLRDVIRDEHIVQAKFGHIPGLSLIHI